MGNGISTKIWKDKWLSSQPSFRPITLQEDWDENELVYDLIDDETK